MTVDAMQVRDDRGDLVPLPVARWFGALDDVDLRVVATIKGPVLDVGCGPGRHVVALAERGVPALGIDITDSALELARERGVPVIERSVFDRVPAAGRWTSVLLLDGNIGIGGEPAALLRRVHELLRSGGVAVVEVEPAGTRYPSRPVRFERGARFGPWFRLACVTTDEINALAHAAGFACTRVWHDGRRSFAALRREEAA
ncbi:MAG TPA: class I SAM-dependent methyltransferase [Acidimicrobiia bacterium]|jgi:SAM-dependent methyltransferase